MKHPDLKILKKVFRKYKGIQAVYLFGSAVHGKLHGESDLDLAVMPADVTIRKRKLDILEDLARHGFCDVDLVILDNDDIVMQYEAVKHNKLVYYKPNFDKGGAYSMIVRKYLDFYPYLSVQRKAMKARILNGSC